MNNTNIHLKEINEFLNFFELPFSAQHPPKKKNKPIKNSSATKSNIPRHFH